MGDRQRETISFWMPTILGVVTMVTTLVFVGIWAGKLGSQMESLKETVGKLEVANEKVNDKLYELNSAGSGGGNHNNNRISIGDDRPKSAKAYLSARDLADAERVNTDTIRRWANAGRILGAKKTGSTWSFPRDYVVQETGMKHAGNVHETGTKGQDEKGARQ